MYITCTVYVYVYMYVLYVYMYVHMFVCVCVCRYIGERENRRQLSLPLGGLTVSFIGLSVHGTHIRCVQKLTSDVIEVAEIQGRVQCLVRFTCSGESAAQTLQYTTQQRNKGDNYSPAPTEELQIRRKCSCCHVQRAWHQGESLPTVQCCPQSMAEQALG